MSDLKDKSKDVDLNPRSVDADLNPRSTKGKKPKKTGLWANIRVIVEAVAIALVVHTLLFKPFYIPSASMKPNLLIGDYLIISKFSYGYSKYSCPFALCPISGRIWSADPERGDVVVFSNPGPGRHHGQAYVKRAVGLPGDKIQMRDGLLYINDVVAAQTPLEPYAEPLTDHLRETQCLRSDAEFCYIEQSIETLPNGVEHSVFNIANGALADNTQEWTVPDGHFFMMGDNRDRSNDSRIDVGLVPAERLIGKATLIVFSSSGSSLFKFWEWRSDRYFQWVR